MDVGRIKMNKLNVIYEDNHIIVVEKQPNIPSQADKTEDIDMLSIIKNYLKEKAFLQHSVPTDMQESSAPDLCFLESYCFLESCIFVKKQAEPGMKGNF